MFPEGTRSQDGHVQRFRHGTARLCARARRCRPCRSRSSARTRRCRRAGSGRRPAARRHASATARRCYPSEGETHQDLSRRMAQAVARALRRGPHDVVGFAAARASATRRRRSPGRRARSGCSGGRARARCPAAATPGPGSRRVPRTGGEKRKRHARRGGDPPVRPRGLQRREPRPDRHGGRRPQADAPVLLPDEGRAARGVPARPPASGWRSRSRRRSRARRRTGTAPRP